MPPWLSSGFKATKQLSMKQQPSAIPTLTAQLQCQLKIVG